ncbi:MAG: VCBS repeat-containing protein, partial [Acidobacteria bacterium]|nr:VCBS repeat-containing protein [Acidobacteriota bacterium]
MNNGTGGWRAPLNLPAALEAYGVGAPIHVTDLDGDGKQDLLWNGVASLKGDGAGKFSVLQVLPRGTKSLGDFNGDGKVDVIYLEVDANDRSLLQIALND